MRTEIKRMLVRKKFLGSGAFGSTGDRLWERLIRSLRMDLLPAWSFLSMEKKAFYSETACFFVPLAAVLPWSDSFLGEWKGGFLKAVLPRTGRLDYVGNKVVTVMVSGFLAWLLAGILVLFGYFVVFFPLEKQGDFPLEEGISFVCAPAPAWAFGWNLKYAWRNGSSRLPVGIYGLGAALCGLLFLHDPP